MGSWLARSRQTSNKYPIHLPPIVTPLLQHLSILLLLHSFQAPPAFLPLIVAPHFIGAAARRRRPWNCNYRQTTIRTFSRHSPDSQSQPISHFLPNQIVSAFSCCIAAMAVQSASGTSTGVAPATATKRLVRSATLPSLQSSPSSELSPSSPACDTPASTTPPTPNGQPAYNPRAGGAKYKHIFAIHAQARPSTLSHDTTETPSFIGFRNLMVIVLSKLSFPSPEASSADSDASVCVQLSETCDWSLRTT